MATAAQIAANIENAKHSTGPRAEEGKAASSRNGITHGLYARKDFIRPELEQIFAKLQSGLQTELNPVGVQEQTLVDEIRRATWRLIRCGEVEARLLVRTDDGSGLFLDPMESHDSNEKIQNNVDRARSQAHRLLHKCTAELRKLQAERKEQRRPQTRSARDNANPIRVPDKGAETPPVHATQAKNTNVAVEEPRRQS